LYSLFMLCGSNSFIFTIDLITSALPTIRMLYCSFDVASREAKTS
jgi:hypothetical protein